MLADQIRPEVSGLPVQRFTPRSPEPDSGGSRRTPVLPKGTFPGPQRSSFAMSANEGDRWCSPDCQRLNREIKGIRSLSKIAARRKIRCCFSRRSSVYEEPNFSLTLLWSLRICAIRASHASLHFSFNRSGSSAASLDSSSSTAFLRRLTECL